MKVPYSLVRRVRCGMCECITSEQGASEKECSVARATCFRLACKTFVSAPQRDRGSKYDRRFGLVLPHTPPTPRKPAYSI